MWRPTTYADVQAVLQWPETSSLEFKREVGTSATEIAKDIAAMTVDGGVIAYGIDEANAVAAALTPVPLSGTPERIQQIANSNIDPVPSFEIRVIPDPGQQGHGFVIVDVPASPLAPHMVRDRFPARSGTTTRYLSQREVERFYAQRSSLATALQSREPLAGFLRHTKSIDEVRANVAELKVMVVPATAYQHPLGARSLPALLFAANEGHGVHFELIDQTFHARLLEQVLSTGWAPHSSTGFQAGHTITEVQVGEQVVVGAATYSHSGPLSYEVRIGLSARDEPAPGMAHEQIWVSEAIGAIAMAGAFFRAVPGISFASVDVSLWGLRGRTKSVPGPRAGLPQIADGLYASSGLFTIAELEGEPVRVAQELLDPLLVSFDASRVLEDLLQEPA